MSSTGLGSLCCVVVLLAIARCAFASMDTSYLSLPLACIDSGGGVLQGGALSASCSTIIDKSLRSLHTGAHIH